MTLFVFKIVYLLLVTVGLIVNINELRSAMTVYQTVTSAGINGARQVLASHFVRKALMLVGVQVFLAVPAVISLFLTSEVRATQYGTALTVFAILSHMAAVLCLMLMAFMSWYDRNFSMDMLTSEARRAKDVDTTEKAEVAKTLRDQIQETTNAAQAGFQEANHVNQKIETLNREFTVLSENFAQMLAEVKALRERNGVK